ncbi:MAG TPA: hypothetical protein VGO66_12535 [Solirubrobacterales bacterium]|nr:hypothetical protein [Solirubrobacterales bacterium]
MIGVTTGLLVATAGLSAGDPSPQLLRDLAQLGAALFIAYSVATAGASFSEGRIPEEHLNWLGSICGVGASGLVGIGAGIALAAHREAGNASALDVIGLCWVIASIALMGLFVAALPYAVYSWRRSAQD